MIDDRHADAESTTETEVLLRLNAPALVAQARGVGACACSESDGRKPLCFGNLLAQFAAFHLQREALKLRSVAQSIVIDGLKGRNVSQRHLVRGFKTSDVKLLRVCNLEELLELSLVIAHFTFRLHHVVFVLCTLCGQLHEVCFAHLAYFQHFFSAVFIHYRRFESSFLHADILFYVSYLHVELGNLLFDVARCRDGVAFVLLH